MSIQNSHQISGVKVMLKVGADGSGIESIEKTGTSGIVDTYTITMTDGTKSTFTVTNGSSIESIEKTSTVGLVDTYTITLTNGDTSTFEVHNASGGGMLAHILITSDAGSTVTVTTPSGDVITATQVTGSTTQWECDTQEYGVHIIDAVLDGDDAQYSLTVDTCKVYSIDDSHMHATITVTYPQGFTCRCQGNGENYYANSNPYTFSVHSLGTFTITATDGTTTYTETVVISSSSQAETIYCPSVANAPTEDVQLWLMYGDITDKNYTTLSEVLADTTTYSALIADHDAVDYLKRSKSWCGVGLVPKMTSATTPSGTVVASDVGQYSQAGYFAFDGNIDEANKWASGTSTQAGQYVGYIFTSPQVVKSVMVVPFVNSASLASFKFKIQGTHDNGNTWEDVSSEITVTPTNLTAQYFAIDNDTAYDGYRYYFTTTTQTNATILVEGQFYLGVYDGTTITGDSTAMSILGLNNYASDTLLSDADWLEAICNSQYFESVLNVKVPTMTSNTTPSGVVSASSYLDSRYAPYMAFSGSTTAGWMGSDAEGRFDTGTYIQYQFPNTLEVRKGTIQLIGSDSNGLTMELLASNDGFVNDTHTLVSNIAFASASSRSVNFTVNNTGAYSYYRLRSTSVNSASGDGMIVQFYGRVAV